MFVMKKRGLILLLIGVGTLIYGRLFSQTPSSLLFEMSEIKIDTVGFNTESSDFGPSFVGNELWFSAYTDRQVKKAVNLNFDKIFYSLFRVPVDGRGVNTDKNRVLVKDFNTGFHEGPVAYCEKTGELFVTLSNTVHIDVEVDGIILKKQQIRLRIVSMIKDGGVWKLKEEMPFNDKIYSVGHPTVSPSGDTLFFTSDLPSQSIGGTDIFMVTRQNGIWGKPVSVGGNINTTGNEMFPFFHPSGILIFASDKQADKVGGLDLYSSDLFPYGFTPPTPIKQLNTPFDDFGLIVHSSDESGYFVSNRLGHMGSDDIFHFTLKKNYLEVTGIVTDEETGDPINGALVNLQNCDGGILDKETVGSDGKFTFKVSKGGCYQVLVSAEKYISKTTNLDHAKLTEIKLKHNRSLELVVLDYDTRKVIPNVVIQIGSQGTEKLDSSGVLMKKLNDEKELIINVSAKGYLNQTVKVNTTLNYMTRQEVLLMKLEMNKSFVLDNIYYELNKWDILPSAQKELDKLIEIMKENPEIKVELGSHTDSRASDQYNLTLSQKRSESAVRYIIKNGIPKERITAKGYGETKLLNRCSNGVTCSEEEHAKNRRTEFKIIGFVK
jgi:outer membrane protein OmpA-like peptidoglycan-associated protein